MDTESRFRRRPKSFAPKLCYAIAVATAIGVTACSTSESPDAEGAPSSESGEVTARTDAGTEVALSWIEGGQHIGANPLEIRIKGQTTAPILDLLSPEMPMHGVLRYTADVIAPGRFSAAIDVPMEGTWALYVDLDGGKEVAEYVFTVHADTNTEALHH